MSKNTDKTCSFRAQASLMYASRRTSWSVVLRLALAPLCHRDWRPLVSRNQFSLLLTILSLTLQGQHVRDMGLRFVGFEWSLSGLGMGITIASFHSLGNVRILHALLIASRKSCFGEGEGEGSSWVEGCGRFLMNW